MSIKSISSLKSIFSNASKKVRKKLPVDINNQFIKLSKKTNESSDVFQKVIVPKSDSTKKLLGYIAGIGTVGSIGTVGAIETSKTINSTTARQERPKTLKSTTA